MVALERDLEPALELGVNRLVIGDESLCVEALEPLGDLPVFTPSGRRLLHHAAQVRVRCRSGRAVFVFGESDVDGLLVGGRAASARRVSATSGRPLGRER
jgi:hypothetical protein